MNEHVFFLSATEVAARMRSGELSPVEYTEGLLKRIEGSELNAYAEVAAEQALDAARAAERRISVGDVDATRRPLLGVPVSVKDNIETADLRTTYGSAVFADFIPDEDAVCVARLRAAGATIIGKTALPEFAAKSVVDSPLLGVTRNPWDTSRVVGGSSGGAAAAVAAGLGPLAIGNDQAGSVRIPAAVCGVAGLKPSGGRIPFAPNQSPWEQMFHVGLISRTVADLELGLSILEGMDSADPLSHPVSEAALGRAAPRVAWSATLGFGRVDPEVLAVVKNAIDDLGLLIPVDEATIDLAEAEMAYATLVPFKRAVEIGDRLAEWEPFMDPDVVSYVRLGMSMGPDDVRRGMIARTRTYAEVERVLLTHDFIATPTVSVAAFPIGQTTPALIQGRPTSSFRDWFPFTYPFNLTGHPAVSLPAGFTAEGLPVGIQIVGRRHADRELLALAARYEASRPWAAVRPRSH
jgi:amidase